MSPEVDAPQGHATHAIGHALARWVNLAVSRPRLMLAGLLALAVLGAVLAASFLGVNTDTKQMLSASLPYRQAEARLDKAFPDLDTPIAIVVRAPSSEQADDFVRELSTRLRRLKAIDTVIAPSAEPFFRDNAFLFMKPATRDDRLDKLSKASSVLAAVSANPTAAGLVGTIADTLDLAHAGKADASPLGAAMGNVARVIDGRLAGKPQFLSWEGLVAAQDKPFVQRVVLINPEQDFMSLAPAKAALKGVNAALAQIKSEAEFAPITVGVTGDAALRADELVSVTSGVFQSFALSVFLVGLVLVFALRSGWMVTAALSALLIGVALTSGFASLIVDALNLVSVAFTVLMFGIGVDFMIHLCLDVQKGQSEGRSLDESLGHMAQHLGPTLLLAALTGAIGFFAFIPTKFVGISQLGLISGFGVMMALGVALTLLPAALSLARPKLRKADKMARELQGHHKLRHWAAALVAMLTLAALPLLPHVRFNADPMGLRDPASKSVQVFAWLFQGEDSGPYKLSVTADNRAEAERLHDALTKLPEVETVSWLGSFAPADQDDTIATIDFTAGTLTDALKAPVTPTPAQASLDALKAARARLAAVGDPANPPQYAMLLASVDRLIARAQSDARLLGQVNDDLFAFYPRLIGELRRQLAPGPVTEADAPAWLKARYVNDDGMYRLEVSPRADVRDIHNRRAFVEAVERLTPHVSGAARNVLEAGDAVAAAMSQATLYAVLISAVVIILVTRRPSNAVIILIPLMMAAALTCAAGVLLDLPFNYANVIVLPLLIGLSVDSGIYLTHSDGNTLAGARWGPERATARSIFFSAFTTIDSFGTLAISDHRGLSSMGILLAIGVAFTVVCTLLVSPSLLALRADIMSWWLSRKRSGQHVEA